MGDALNGLRQRALDRLRGEPNIAQMVAEGMQLGYHTHIARPVYLDRGRPWLITIEDYANLGPGVILITHDASLHNHTGQTRIAPVVIGKRVMVGAGAILLPGTNIGDDSVIAAGAVVRGEIPPGSVVAGDPAKVSEIGVVVAWHRASAKGAPNWPVEGWSKSTGITDARKREQREALADGASGYIPSRSAPGSPHALSQQREQASAPGSPHALKEGQRQS